MVESGTSRLAGTIFFSCRLEPRVVERQHRQAVGDQRFCGAGDRLAITEMAINGDEATYPDPLHAAADILDGGAQRRRRDRERIEQYIA